MAVRQLASGRYQVRITDPITGDRPSYGTYRVKADAEKRDRQVQSMLDNGIDPKTAEQDRKAKEKIQGLTLRQFADEYRESKRNKYGQPLKDNYKRECIRYVNLADFADKPLREITPQEVRTWFTGLSNRTGNQASKAYSWIKTVFTAAVDERLITDNPCRIKAGGTFTTTRELPIPSTDQVAIMYEHAEGDLKAILALSAGGGLRRGEILELRNKNIQVEQMNGRKVVYIDIKHAVEWKPGGQAVQTTTKTPGSVRRIPLDQIDGQIILEHQKAMNAISPDALLFTSNRTENTHYAMHRAYTGLQKLFAIAGYDGSPHRLRAYAATQYGLKGATAIEIMDRFGHRNIKTAMKYQRSTGREVELLDRKVQ
jgi:integrase